MQYASGLVGTLGDDHARSRLDIDGLPRLVQIEAERFPITCSCEVDDTRFCRGRRGESKIGLSAVDASEATHDAANRNRILYSVPVAPARRMDGAGAFDDI